MDPEDQFDVYCYVEEIAGMELIPYSCRHLFIKRNSPLKTHLLSTVNTVLWKK